MCVYGQLGRDPRVHWHFDPERCPRCQTLISRYPGTFSSPVSCTLRDLNGFSGSPQCHVCGWRHSATGLEW